MQSWDAIGLTTQVTRTYLLPAKLRDAGVTISSFEVGQAVYPDGIAAPDADILDGAGARNATAIVFGGQTWAANQAILQPVKGSGGRFGVRYVITFTMALSNGDPAYVEDCLQPVSTYVPP